MQVKEQRDIETEELQGYIVDGMSVPIAEGNRHYQEVIQWIADGNTPDPAYTEADRTNYLANKQLQEISNEVKNLLDSKAREYKWDDMKSARAGAVPIKDTDSPIIIAMKQNAASLNDWYFQVWAKAVELEALGVPMTVDECLAQMPIYERV